MGPKRRGIIAFAGNATVWSLVAIVLGWTAGGCSRGYGGCCPNQSQYRVVPPHYGMISVRIQIINETDDPVDGQTGSGEPFHAPPRGTAEAMQSYPEDRPPLHFTIYFNNSYCECPMGQTTFTIRGPGNCACGP